MRQRTEDIHNEVREKMILTVYRDYYEQHYEVFKPPNTEVKNVFVEGENHTDDEIHKQLLKKYLKSQKELRNYEYEKRHNLK